MPATHTGIAAQDLRRVEFGILRPDGVQLGLHLWLLGRFLQIVFPARLHGVIGMPLHPQAAQAVLHHVAHDPVRREKLRGGGDLFLADLDVLFEPGEHLVLRLGVVILIQPTDDLNGVLPVVLRDGGDHLLDDAALPEQVVREQQLGVVRDGLKQPRQHAGHVVALGDEQVLKKLFLLIVLLQFEDLLHVQPVQLDVERLGQYLRVERATVIREHAHIGGKIAVDFHEPQGDETVKPGVGHFLHHLLVTVPADVNNQHAPLRQLIRGQHMPMNRQNLFVHGLIFLYAKPRRLLRHALDQLSPRPHGKFLDGVFIHGVVLLSVARLIQLNSITALHHRGQGHFDLCQIGIDVLRPLQCLGRKQHLPVQLFVHLLDWWL